MFKNFNLVSIISIVIISLFVGVVFVYADWSVPLNQPPTCIAGNPGCNTPINTGSTNQIKLGSLGVYGLNTSGIFLNPLSGDPFACDSSQKGFLYFNGSSNKHFMCNGSGWADYQGPAGAQGIQGIAGATGAIGATGATGATGSQGPKGDKGDIGATGSQGPAGATGLQGPVGGMNIQVFTTNGTFTIPTGVTRIRVDIVGGGGGGGKSGSGGNGGGGGGWRFGVFDVTPEVNYIVTVGSGGSGGSGNIGGNGGNTSFGSLMTADGGKGNGVGGGSIGGNGGFNGTGGSIGCNGGVGGSSGGNYSGGGGKSGGNGGSYGGGGGGGKSFIDYSNPGFSAGAGATGVVVVQW